MGIGSFVVVCARSGENMRVQNDLCAFKRKCARLEKNMRVRQRDSAKSIKKKRTLQKESP